MRRTLPAITIMIVIAALCFAPAALAASWVIGGSGIALTDLTLDITGTDQTFCGVDLGLCDELSLSSDTVTYESDASHGNPNGGYMFYLPGSESNMSVIDGASFTYHTTNPSGGGMSIIGFDSRDSSYCIIFQDFPADGYSNSVGPGDCEDVPFDEVRVNVGSPYGEVTSATVSITGHTTEESSEGGENYAGSGVLLGPFRPVSTSDTYTISDEHGAAFTKSSAPVHSIGGGTITKIETIANMFSVTVAPFGVETEDEYLTYHSLQGVNGEIGEILEAGCVLGLVTDQTTDPILEKVVGIFRFNAPPDILEDWPDYEDSPTDTPCNADQLSTENCVDFNPNFADNARYWNSEGHVEAQTGGPILYSNGAIYQDVTLDSGEAYNVTIIATTALSARRADLEVTFGDATTTMHLNVPVAHMSVRMSSQDLSPGTADYAPDKYRLRIKNVPTDGHPTSLATPVQVLFVCIGTNDPVAPPSDCYFDDTRMLTDAWEADAGVVYTAPPNGTASGAYDLPPDTAIFRDIDISAFSDHDTTFYLETSSFNSENMLLTGRWHAYIRDPVTLDMIQDIGEWDLLAIVLTTNKQSFTLDSGEHVVGDLVIENKSSYIDTPGWHQKINYVCLSVDGGVWPGSENADIQLPFPVDCTECVGPVSLSEVGTNELLGWLADWLRFGWCYLGFILRCYILAALNNIWLTISNFMLGVALFGKWIGMVVTAVAVWVRDGFRFGFNNMVAAIIPIANQIIAWLFSLPIIQSALDTLAIAGIWLDGLFQLIQSVINLILLGVQFIGALLNLIGVAWSAFLGALSAAPSSDFPFPNCSDPGSPLYHACLPLDVTNFLVVHLPGLVLLINVAAFAVFWRQFRKIVRAVREDIFEAG